MNFRISQATEAAQQLQHYFGALGIEVEHTQALGAVARLQGYRNLQEPGDCFSPTPVDWARVAGLDALTHIRLNHGELREVSYCSRKGLKYLAALSDPCAQLSLAQSPALVFEAECSQRQPQGNQDVTEVLLGQLQRAVEGEPGVIDLLDGLRLELFVNDGTGLFRFSPARDELV
jgi:hypothetical protein